MPRRNQITAEIYQQLIISIIGSDYRSARLRIAILILTVTGILINELLPLKVEQLTTLINASWISINSSKRRPSSHKAYLNTLRKELMEKRKRDFEIIFSIKELNSYIFISNINYLKSLRRDTLNKEINFVSRSFRIGFITQLWKDTNDIEFIRKVIVHIMKSSQLHYITIC